MVNGDSDGLGVFPVDSGGLQLLEGESPSLPLLNIILEGGAPDHGPQGLEGTGGDAGGLGHAVLAPPLLAGGLVEPSLDVPLPILMEMGIGHHLVAFGRHDEGCNTKKTK